MEVVIGIVLAVIVMGFVLRISTGLMTQTAPGQRMLLRAQGVRPGRESHPSEEGVVAFARVWPKFYGDAAPSETLLDMWWDAHHSTGITAEQWLHDMRYGKSSHRDSSGLPAQDATPDEIVWTAQRGELHPRIPAIEVQRRVFDRRLEPGEQTVGLRHQTYIFSDSLPQRPGTPRDSLPGWLLVTDRALRWHYTVDGDPSLAESDLVDSPPVPRPEGPRDVRFEDLERVQTRSVPATPANFALDELVVITKGSNRMAHVFQIPTPLRNHTLFERVANAVPRSAAE